MPQLIAFSGQGAQHENMFDILLNDESGKLWLKEASDILHLDLCNKIIVKEYCFDNTYAQLFIAILSMGTFNILSEHQDSDLILCGYSLGEVSAYAVASHLSLSQLISLIQFRAKIMTDFTASNSHNQPAGLAVLLGNINIQMITELIDKYHCYLAIINNHDHFVVGGLKANLNELINKAMMLGVIRAELIKINLPSHTPFLKAATPVFLKYLQEHYSSVSLNYPILNALTTKIVNDNAEMQSILAHELSETLHWNLVMQIATEYNVDVFFELGPRAALKNMFKVFSPHAQTYAIEDFKTMSGLKNKWHSVIQ